LTQEYKAGFEVVRNVPGLSEQPILPIHERERLIVYQGALNEGRGLEAAIMAMKGLPEFRLRLIGEGDLSDQLRELTIEQGLNGRVEFAGYVLPKDLYALTCKAMVGLNVLESRSRSYYYSLANKFFDYMHTGVPSVNMDFPEYRQIIDKHMVGTCISALSSEAIVEAVLKMTGDRDSLAQMIEACSRAREEYTWQNELVKLIKMLAGI
jgi:glycosyltransferase involved in cell wall biosynthesis